MYLQDDRKAPSSVTVVTADEIQKCGYRTLADILRSVRGFYVTYDRNYSYVGVRGFSQPGDYNSRILLLLNGHRLTDNLYNSASIGTEFQIDVDLIDRVEIVRGPSSSLYGTNAFFAVVNVITKDTHHLSGLELAGEVDGFGTYRGRSTYGQRFHGVELLLSGTGYDSAGPARLFFPAFASPSTNNGYALHADYDSSESFFGQLSFGHFTLESVGSTREKGIPTASFNTVFDDLLTRTTDDRGYVDLKYERTLHENTQLTASVYFDRVTYHGVYVYPPVDPSKGKELNEDFGRGDWTGTKVNITRPLFKKHRVTGGASFRDNLRQDQSNYDINPYVAFLNDQRQSKDWALFAQDEFSVLPSLTLSAGVRYDHYETFGGTTNPRLALIYSPRSHTTIKALYGSAFRAPNYYELYYHDGVSQEPNPHLLPETITTGELVWEQDLSSKMRFTADAFESNIRHLIDQHTDPRNNFLFFANTGKARSRGLEFELAGRTLKGIEGRVSYTFQQAVDSATGIHLTNSPEHMAKAEVIWPFARRRMFLGTDLQYMSSRTTLSGPAVEPYTIANLTLSTREFAGGFRLSGSVYNLFNRIYSDSVGAEIRSTMVQQNGRDFRVSLTRVFHFK